MYPVMRVRKNEADLFSGKTKICNSGSWRVPSSDGTGKNSQDLGIPKENIFILHQEMCLKSVKGVQKVDKVHTGDILVDGLGVGDVGNIVLRDRQHLAEDGIMIVVLTLEKAQQPASCRTGYCIQRICICARI